MLQILLSSRDRWLNYLWQVFWQSVEGWQFCGWGAEKWSFLMTKPVAVNTSWHYHTSSSVFMGVHHLCNVTLSCKLMVQHKISPPTCHWDCIFDKRLNWRHESTTTAQLQVNLLTPMDRAMLFNAKSTISHCRPSLITRQRVSVDSKLLRHREMSDITTYLNDNAQTPLGRFVVYTLYNELCSKYGDKSNR